MSKGPLCPVGDMRVWSGVEQAGQLGPLLIHTPPLDSQQQREEDLIVHGPRGPAALVLQSALSLGVQDHGVELLFGHRLGGRLGPLQTQLLEAASEAAALLFLWSRALQLGSLVVQTPRLSCGHQVEELLPLQRSHGGEHHSGSRLGGVGL